MADQLSGVKSPLVRLVGLAPRTPVDDRRAKEGLPCSRVLAASVAAIAAAGMAGDEARGAAGDLDPAFGDLGRVSDFGGYTLWSAEVGDDESVLFGGGDYYCGYFVCDFLDIVGVLKPDGTPDATFADPALASTMFYDTARQSDGKIVAVGRSRLDGAHRLKVVRLLPNGSLDTSFATGGEFTFPDSSVASESGTSILVEPDDRIVVAGRRGMGVVVARLEPDGALDDSFGTGGMFSQGLGAPSHPKIERTATGAYRVVANASPTLEAGPRPTCAVLALTETGLTDDAFGGDGIEFVFGAAAAATCDVLALQGDGKLLVGGSAGRLVRLLPDGGTDPTFRTDVVAEVLDSISALAVGSSGKIFVAGHHREGLAGPTILRLLADGTLDPAFGTDGSTRFNLRSFRPVDPVVHDMSVGSNDALVLAGGMWPFSAGFVARLLGEGPGAAPGIIGIDQASAFGTEQSGEALVTVRRMGGSSGAVAVSYVTRSPEGFAAMPGADYTAVTGRFDWADGDSSERQIVVPILPDSLDESPEFFELVLESAEGGAGLGVHGLEVAIAGTSYPAGEFRFVQTGETISEGSTYELWVTRDFYASGEVSVTVRLAGGSARPGRDFDVSTAGNGWSDVTLSWDDGDSGPKSIFIIAKSDGNRENDESITFELVAPTGGALIASPSQSSLEIENVSNDSGGGHVGGPGALLLGLLAWLRRRTTGRQCGSHASGIGTG
jgi:uncharacterized delta-60 repeat protein